MSTENFGKDDLLKDLAASVAAEARRLNTHFYMGAADALLGEEAGERAEQETLTPNDIQRLEIAATMSRLYEYAFNGEYLDDPHFDVTNGLDWVHANQGADLGELSERIEATVRTAYARWALDSDESDLTLRDVALLARLDERTVRNAAARKDAGRLPTIRVGGSTYVEIAAARAWLAQRKGFVPTKPAPKPSKKAEQVTGRLEFAAFLRGQREKAKMTHEALAQAARLSADGTRMLDRVERGEESFPLEAASGVADALRMPADQFVKKVLEIFYPRQLEALRGLARGGQL